MIDNASWFDPIGLPLKQSYLDCIAVEKIFAASSQSDYGDCIYPGFSNAIHQND